MKKSTSCAVRLVVELTISPLTQQPRSSSALQQNVHSTRRPLALCLFLAAVLVSQNRRDDVLLSSRLSRTTGDSFCPNGIRSGPQAEVTLAASFVTENFFVSSRRQKHNRQCGGKWKRRDASHKPCSAFLCTVVLNLNLTNMKLNQIVVECASSTISAVQKRLQSYYSRLHIYIKLSLQSSGREMEEASWALPHYAHWQTK